MSNINLFPELDNEEDEEQEHHPGSKQTSEEELIVFGYSCKLFRDDFSAKAIDRGQSLIPWNGDENVMIDRYDCRGHLFDLTVWDSDLIKKKSNEHALNAAEKRMEDECDQERYCDLYRDMEKEALREEEELKRLNADRDSYNQVGFTYEQSEGSVAKTAEDPSQTLDDDDEYEPFYPSEKLQIPYGMDIPESIKLNRVIEKTAGFVSTSGVQMEIVLKTKQGTNPQFDFLKYDHYLNPYYRHLIIMIKSGKYRPNVDHHSSADNKKKPSTKNGVDQTSSHDEDEGNDSYLHPLLRGGSGDQTNPTKKADEPSRIRAVPMNIHNTAYGQLIKKYEHLRQPAKVIKENEEEKVSPKNDESSPRSESSSSSGVVIPPPPDVKPIIDKLAEYVARNGQEFEESIRTKNDERFGFLERDHIHHNYYQLKLQQCSQDNQRKKAAEDSRLPPTAADESIKLVFKANPEKTLMEKSSQEFHSDGDSPASPPSQQSEEENGEFIGPRPPSPEFLEKMRKQEQRRDRLSEFVREKIVRDKQEERKRKAELLVQKLKKESTPSTVPTTEPPVEGANLNSNLIEKLLNVKDERPASSRLTSPHQSRRSKRSRSKSPSRSKYSRRSRSKSTHHRRRRSAHKRSRTRSKSRSRHRSKRSKTSKYSRSHRRHRHHHRRRSSPSSSSSRSSSSASRSSSSTSASSSSSHEKAKKKKSATAASDESQRTKNPQSSKWDQREPMKTKADDKDLSLSMSTESTISNSMTS